MPHEHSDDVRDLSRALAHIADHGPLPELDAVALWLDLDAVRATFAKILDLLEYEAIEATLAHGTDGVAVTDRGVGRISGYRRGNQYEGHAIAGALCRRLVDPDTGEVIAAVPVDVLRAVVPGCAAPHLTSSRWSRRALAGFVDVDQYEHRGEWVQKMERAGL